MGASVKSKQKLISKESWPGYKRCRLCHIPMPLTSPEPCHYCVKRWGKEVANFKVEEKILVNL